MASAASGALTPAMPFIAVIALHQNLSRGDSDSRRWPFFLPRGQSRAYTNIPDAIIPKPLAVFPPGTATPTFSALAKCARILTVPKPNKDVAALHERLRIRMATPEGVAMKRATMRREIRYKSLCSSAYREA